MVNLFQCILIVHTRNILENKQKLFIVIRYRKNSIFPFNVDIEIQNPNYAPAFQKIDKENTIFKTDIDLLCLWLPSGN